MEAVEAEVLGDAEQLAERAAMWFAELARAAPDRFAVALSGGSTPRRLYQRLAEMDLPWQRIHWFWGDERFVPPDDPLSNYRMTREALFDRAPVPEANIHRVPTVGLEPATAAERYEGVLQDYYGGAALRPARPLFDVVLLGLGTDGHTASLFPGTAVLEERQVWVAPVLGAKEEPRITLTYPALESSRHVAFLVAGADKRRMLGRLLSGDAEIPAGRLSTGRARVFADRSATGR
ncbi:MAG: 6-phosphogluconolactonase [Reyranellaceae bacterium]